MKTPAILLLTGILIATSGCHTVKSVGNAMWPFGGKKKSDTALSASTGSSGSSSSQDQGEAATPVRPSVPARQPAVTGGATSASPNTVSGAQPYSNQRVAPTSPDATASTHSYTLSEYLAVMTPGEVAVLQERARSSGRINYELTDFLTEKEKAALQERALPKRTSAR